MSHKPHGTYEKYVKRPLDCASAETALCWYVNNEVSLGCCAHMAGMSRENFIQYLSEKKVSIFHYDDRDEFIEELKNA